MGWQVSRVIICALLAAALGGCQATTPSAGAAPNTTAGKAAATALETTPANARDITVSSRGVEVPATFTSGAAETAGRTNEATPLVVFLHGHGGSRHEAGGFTQVAMRLATAGISSIRMDFPGCGDSQEPFRKNRLANMLADARSARDWALANANIDERRMALFGFSMGGRLAITLAAEDPRMTTLALWAPSADAGASALYDFFGGAENFARMQSIAEAEGFVPFTTTWGQDQELSAGWFKDMAGSNPLELVQKFPGKLFVLYGSNDTVVTPAEADRVLANATAAVTTQRFVVDGADHGLGLFSEEPELTEQAVARTVEFLTASLNDQVEVDPSR